MDAKALSAVIGVILMLCITVAVAGSLFVFLNMQEGSDSEEVYTISGTYQGFYQEGTFGKIDIYIIDNEHYKIYGGDQGYIDNYIGQEVNFLVYNTTRSGYDYSYLGIYLIK
jgi:hypothetical protein